MTAVRTTVRPRPRSVQSHTQCDLPAANAPQTAARAPEHDLPPLPVLARLPDVSFVADKGKLAIRLDWLTQLDWKKMRRINLDPNWLAGGVLSLVLVLLAVITLNRGSKPADSSPGEIDAPSWHGAAAGAPASQNASIGESALAKQAGSSTRDSTAQSVASGVTGLSTENRSVIAASQADVDASRVSLEGIYYPCTPHGMPDANLFREAQATGHPTAHDRYENGIRTAQRSPFVPRGPQPAPVQPAFVQPIHAQLDGIITQP